SHAAGSAATLAGVGNLSVAADGSFVFTPLADWNGAAPRVTYSTNTGASSTLGISVQPVNDAPVRTDGAAAAAMNVGTNGAVSLGLAGAAYGPGGGTDEAAQSLTVTISAVPPAMVGTVVLADGHTPVVAGASYSLADLRGMQFVPAPTGNGSSANFAWIVRDSGGTAAGGSDSTGGVLRIQVGSLGVDTGVKMGAAVPQPTATTPASIAPLVQAPVASTSSAPAASPGRITGTVDTALGASLDGIPGVNLLGRLLGFAPPQQQAPVDAVRTTPLEQREQRNLALASPDLAGDFVLTGFAGLEGSVLRVSAEQFQQALRSGLFLEELNRLRRQLNEQFDLDRTTAIEVAGLSLGVSLVYVLWLIRGGVLLGSYLSALPAWRLLDPLPVLARADDDEEDDEDEALSARPTPADPLRGFA
ncbi:MAG TPA: hypothetical protein VGF26_04960, partial [Ramlibacter sp.]